MSTISELTIQIKNIDDQLKALNFKRKKLIEIKTNKKKLLFEKMTKHQINEANGFKREKLEPKEKSKRLTKDEKKQLEKKKINFIRDMGITQPIILLEKIKNMQLSDEE